MVRTILLALTLSAPALAAQQPGLVGTWRVSYPGELRVENGVFTPIMATGTLTVAVQGDSLIANLVTEPSAQLRARPPLRLATKSAPGDAVFESRSQATVNMNGNMQSVTSVSTWIFKAAGDKLEGSVERKIEGMDMANRGPQPLTGTRQKA